MIKSMSSFLSYFICFKQKTAYEVRISDWSSDVCSSDLAPQCATIAHFGRYDAGIPMEGVEALIAKDHPTAQVFVYEAGHGFNSDRRKDYHEASSEQARERTLMLFRACGG